MLSELAVAPGQLLWLEGMTYCPEGDPWSGWDPGALTGGLEAASGRTSQGSGTVVCRDDLEQCLANFGLLPPTDADRRRISGLEERLGLKQAAVFTVERMTRLMVGLVLATLILALLGLFGLPQGFRRAVLARGKGSWLWLALQLFEQAEPRELKQALRSAAVLRGLP